MKTLDIQGQLMLPITQLVLHGLLQLIFQIRQAHMLFIKPLPGSRLHKTAPQLLQTAPVLLQTITKGLIQALPVSPHAL